MSRFLANSCASPLTASRAMSAAFRAWGSRGVTHPVFDRAFYDVSANVVADTQTKISTNCFTNYFTQYTGLGSSPDPG